MTVVARATIAAAAFELGDILRTNISSEVELTQLIPLETGMSPYFWMSTDETKPFEAEIREDPRVDRLIRHEEQAGKTLYHIEWALETDGFLGSARKYDVTVERGTGTAEEWTFRLRTPDLSTLRSFHEECHDRGFPLRITRGSGIELPTDESHGTATSTEAEGVPGPPGDKTGTASPPAPGGAPMDGIGDASPFREIVDNLDEVVWMTDPDKEEVLYVNPAHEEVWGQPREELYEEPLSFLDAIHPDDRERVRAALDSQPEGDYEETYRIVRPDGSVRWIRDRAVSIRDEEGEVYRVAGIAEDVTERTEREDRLARQNERLVELSRLNDLIRSVHGAIVDATTREEIATSVCQPLAQNDPYAAAWIGGYRDQQVAIHATAGAIDEGSETARIPADDDSLTDALVGTAHRTRAVHVIQDLQERENVDPWHKRLLDQGCRGAVAIPLTAGEALHGVLVLYTDRPDAFDEEEVAILRELGETIGQAIRAAGTRKALIADSATELEFAVSDSRSFFVAASDDLECRFSLEGLVPLEGDRLLHYVTVDGASPDALRERAAEAADIDTCRVVSETEEGAVVEFRVSGTSASRVLMDYGATVRSAVADGGTGRIVVEMPPDADVRPILDGLREVCPGAQLIAKRPLDQPVRTVQQFRNRLTEQLTDKQLNAIRAAYFAGYFEWPRESTAEEIAEQMPITPSTFHFHLRHTLDKVLHTFLKT